MRSLLIIVIITITCSLCLTILVTNNQEEKIHRKIESIQGEVIDIDYRVLDKGPFWYANKGTNVYRITYIQDNEEKIGWVKFGLTAKYKLDYKK